MLSIGIVTFHDNYVRRIGASQKTEKSPPTILVVLIGSTGKEAQC